MLPVDLGRDFSISLLATEALQQENHFGKNRSLLDE
jgi:hypothetical protein